MPTAGALTNAYDNTTTASYVVWSNWTTVTSTTCTTDAWTCWNIVPTATASCITWTTSTTGTFTWYTAAEETQEARATRIARESQYEARLATEVAERQAKIALARQKAKTLLLSMLAVKQQEQLQKERFFEVIGKATRRTYRIREGVAGNIRVLDTEGREVTQYCAHPNGIPTEDVMLAQKLQIEHDEETFLRVANATPLLRSA